jgi:glutathione S-transferase
MITVYGVPRSRTARVLWMLEELELPYDNVKTHFATGETRTPEFLGMNPNGHVPVLRDGDVVLWESLAINLYLARKYGGGLWPGAVADEGRVYQWTLWAMTELEEPLIAVLLHRVVFPEAQRDPAKAADGEKRVRKPIGVLDGALGGRPYLLGDEFTVADLNVASVLSWAPLAGLDLSHVPQASAWLARCTARPAFGRVG